MNQEQIAVELTDMGASNEHDDEIDPVKFTSFDSLLPDPEKGITVGDRDYCTELQSNLADPRFVVKVMMVWLFVIVVIFAMYGLYESAFFGFGPNSGINLFSITIDTWPKWTGIMLLNLFDQILFEWATEVVRPWLVNSLQDHKTTHVDETLPGVFFIVNGYELCGYVRLIINIRMIFTQVDFLIAVFVGNFIAMNYTTWNYLRGKTLKVVKEVNVLRPPEGKHSS
jgi:hypothetical protein